MQAVLWIAVIVAVIVFPVMLSRFLHQRSGYCNFGRCNRFTCRDFFWNSCCYLRVCC